MERSTSPVLRVLCVDDHKDSADSLAILLELAGFEACVCYDGPSALARLQQFHPDACIIDLNMPGMDGDELGRRIRAILDGRAITLVAITAMGDESARARTSAAGFDLHLLKPVDPDRLAIVLADIVILRGDTSWMGDETLDESASSMKTVLGRRPEEIFTTRGQYHVPRNV